MYPENNKHRPSPAPLPDPRPTFPPANESGTFGVNRYLGCRTNLRRGDPDAQPLQRPVHFGATQRPRSRGVECNEGVSDEESFGLDPAPHCCDDRPVLQQVELVGYSEHARHRCSIHWHLFIFNHTQGKVEKGEGGRRRLTLVSISYVRRNNKLVPQKPVSAGR